jgi:hypothetical protein
MPREVLVKQGGKAIGGIGGGAALLILRAIASAPAPALIAGGIITAIGVAIASKSKDERVAGAVTIGAGVVTILAGLPFIGGIASSLMWISGFGLVIAGGVSLYKFFKGLKSRR